MNWIRRGKTWRSQRWCFVGDEDDDDDDVNDDDNDEVDDDNNDDDDCNEIIPKWSSIKN